jgi:hypothetical protein
MDAQTYLRRNQAAAHLYQRCGMYTPETLAKLACVGGGPPFRKVGPFPLYTREDLDAWLAQRMTPTVRSTAELSTQQQTLVMK